MGLEYSIETYTGNKILDPEDWVVDFCFANGESKRLYVYPIASENAAIKASTQLAKFMMGGTLPEVDEIKLNRRWQVDPHFRKQRIEKVQGP